MKKRFLNKAILFFAICLTIVFGLQTSALDATFFDDFSDSTKCVAKSSNILFESETSPTSKRIIRTNSDDGFVIWELEGLKYTELGVLLYRSTNANINSAVTFEVSSDGLSWTEIQFDAGEPTAESGGWDSYKLTATTDEPTKFIKIVLNETVEISWAIKLDYIKLYDEDDAPETSINDGSQVPDTGDNSGVFHVLVAAALILVLLVIRSIKQIKISKDIN